MASAHRICQTKKVTVYRLCIKDTVEERLLAMAQRKLWLSERVTGRTCNDDDFGL
jgi:SNF2 family DNA or RNA helicase